MTRFSGQAPSYVLEQAPGPTLHTARLTLRPTSLADFDRWCDFLSDEDTARFIGGVQGPAQVWRTMMTMAGSWALTGVGMFSVIETDTGRWLGRIGPWAPLGWPGTEVGWSLHRDAHGQGYALEAAIASIDYAFDVLGWDEVIHCVAPDNLASAKIAARLGSTNKGPGQLPPPFHEAAVDIWSQTKAEWAVNRLPLI